MKKMNLKIYIDIHTNKSDSNKSVGVSQEFEPIIPSNYYYYYYYIINIIFQSGSENQKKTQKQNF